jgi:peroxiredoxin
MKILLQQTNGKQYPLKDMATQPVLLFFYINQDCPEDVYKTAPY